MNYNTGNSVVGLQLQWGSWSGEDVHSITLTLMEKPKFRAKRDKDSQYWIYEYLLHGGENRKEEKPQPVYCCVVLSLLQCLQHY